MIKRFIILALLIAVGILGAYIYLSRKASSTQIEASPGYINNVEAMVRLCAVEVYNEQPIVDTINNKVICAVQKQRGSVTFDIENLRIDESGDTLRIILPPEIVEIYEATDKNSWEVIDTKNIGFLGSLRSGRLSDAEENMVKSRIGNKARQQLYAGGVVRRARAEVAENLKSYLQKMYRKPVEVKDPTPEGVMR